MSVSFEGFEDLRAKLQAIAEIDPVAAIKERRAEIVEAVRAANVAAREAGLDKDGQPLAPVKPATRKRRLRDGGDPGAPPFVPHHAASRAEASLVVEVDAEAGGATIRVRWADAPWLRQHAEGRVRGAPRRDILGMPPGAREAIEGIVGEAVGGVVAGASGRGSVASSGAAGRVAGGFRKRGG